MGILHCTRDAIWVCCKPFSSPSSAALAAFLNGGCVCGVYASPLSPWISNKALQRKVWFLSLSQRVSFHRHETDSQSDGCFCISRNGTLKMSMLHECVCLSGIPEIVICHSHGNRIFCILFWTDPEAKVSGWWCHCMSKNAYITGGMWFLTCPFWQPMCFFKFLFVKFITPELLRRIFF